MEREVHNGQDDHAGLLIADTIRSHPRPGSNTVGNIVGPLSTRATPNGHGEAGVNNQEAHAGHLIPIAATLSAGGHPGSNMPGRRREDDVNLITGIDWQHSGATVEDGTPTLTTERTPADSGGALGGVRRLMPIECERLMGWADRFTEFGADGASLADSHRYRLIGNGVAAPVAEWIGRRLHAAIAADRAGTPAASEGRTV